MAVLDQELAEFFSAKEMKMGKFRKSETAAGDHRGDNDPADKNHEWLEIYAKLKESIGEWPAYNWFGHCRYLSCHDNTIRLEHWTPFAAEEALKRHGMDLCKAAGVKRALVRYNGGRVPNGCTGRKVDGHATYRIPAQSPISPSGRRLGGLWTGRLPPPAKGRPAGEYEVEL